MDALLARRYCVTDRDPLTGLDVLWACRWCRGDVNPDLADTHHCAPREKPAAPAVDIGAAMALGYVPRVRRGYRRR